MLTFSSCSEYGLSPTEQSSEPPLQGIVDFLMYANDNGGEFIIPTISPIQLKYISQSGSELEPVIRQSSILPGIWAMVIQHQVESLYTPITCLVCTQFVSQAGRRIHIMFL